MLYPITTDSRVVMDLSGIWKFMIDDEVDEIDVTVLCCLPGNALQYPVPLMTNWLPPKFASIVGMCGMKRSFISPTCCANNAWYSVSVLRRMKRGCI